MACIKEIKKAAEGLLSEDEVDSLFSALKKIKKRSQNPAKSINDEMLEKASEIIDSWVQGVKVEKRNQAFNLIARKRAFDWIDNYKSTNTKASDADAYKAYLVGLGQGQDSIGARMRAKELGVMSSVVSKLTEGDYLPVLNSRAIDREIAQEMWEIKDGGRPGITGNADAKTIAEIFHKGQKMVVQMQNDVGTWIRPLPGYIVKQSHDMFKLRRTKQADWVNEINPKMDWDKMAPFLDDAERVVYLERVYENLATGNHFVSKGSQNSDQFLDLSDGFKGPKNIAKKISSERVLHFKTADDFVDYNDKFGTKNIAESFFFGVQRGARNAALMEGLGTNPQAMHNIIIKQLTERNKGNTKVIDSLSGRHAADTAQWYIDQITGELDRPNSANVAVVSSAFRAVESFSKLTAAVLASVTDMSTKISQAQFNGIGFLEGFKNNLDSIFIGRGRGEVKEIADSLSAGFDGLMGQVLSRFGAMDNVPGVFNKMVQHTFKWTGLNWWTDAHKTGFSLMISRNLAFHRGKSFDQLSDKLQNALGLYLKPEQWDIIRQLPTQAADGVEYITPKSVEMMTDAQIKSIIGADASPRKIRASRDSLETALRNYFVDQSDSGIPTPGEREKALLRIGTRPGTIPGEAVRFMAQFKAFPVTFLTKAMGKHFMNGKANYAASANLFLMSTVMGYFAMTLKDLSKNRTPRDPTHDPAKTLLAAMSQGGGIGIYGDFLFGEANRFGGGIIDSLAGPVAGSASQAFDIVMGVRDKGLGDDPKLGTKLLNFAKNHSPYINFFYTRAAMDLMIFNGVQEHMNPGYLNRTESRLRRENEQEFIINPR